MKYFIEFKNYSKGKLKKFKTFYFQLLLLSVLSVNSFGQQVTVSAKFDTTYILIGKQTHLILQAVVSRNFPIKFPVLKDSLVSNVQILNLSKVDTTVQNGMLLLTQQCLVTSFDSGVYEIPPLAFTYKNNAKTDSVFTSPVTLKVYTLPVDTTKRQLYDIKDPIKTPLSFAEILPYLLWIIPALLVICVIVYLIVRLINKKPIIPVRKVVEPPHVIALRELDKLNEEKLWQNNQVKSFHTRLTEILRVYMEARFEIAAMEKTTDEIMTEFKNRSTLDNVSSGLIYNILSMADMVKFAKAYPSPGENEKSMDSAVAFVNNTKLEVLEEEKMKNEGAAGSIDANVQEHAITEKGISQ